MKNNNQKLVLAGVLCALCVVGSFISFPVLGSKCAPVQHFVNVICAVVLGRYYGVSVAFSASVIRNALGIGSLMAFPGSMIGAILSSILYNKTGKIYMAIVGEVIGTGLIGGLLAYPVATLLMGIAGQLSFYVFVVPFLISTLGGSILAGAFLYSLKNTKVIENLKG